MQENQQGTMQESIQKKQQGTTQRAPQEKVANKHKMELGKNVSKNVARN